MMMMILTLYLNYNIFNLFILLMPPSHNMLMIENNQNKFQQNIQK